MLAVDPVPLVRAALARSLRADTACRLWALEREIQLAELAAGGLRIVPWSPDEPVELALAREMIVEMEDPRHGKVTQFGQPIKLSETPGRPRTAAPYAGEHTDEVLRELGMKAEEIAALRRQKIVS